MENKKIATVLLIIAAVAVVLVAAVAIKSNDKSGDNVAAPASQNQSAVGSKANQSANKDADVAAVENDLNSINDSDFDENALSDTEVGL